MWAGRTEGKPFRHLLQGHETLRYPGEGCGPPRKTVHPGGPGTQVPSPARGESPLTPAWVCSDGRYSAAPSKPCTLSGGPGPQGKGQKTPR